MIVRSTLLLETLYELEQLYVCQLKAERAELIRLPQGSLVLNKRSRKTFFYCLHDGEQHSICSDTRLVTQLARKRYMKLHVQELEEELRLVRKLIYSSEKLPYSRKLSDLCRRYDAAALDVHDVIWNKRQQAANGLQSQNPFRREDLIYETNGGIKVRSISEKVIGDLYESLGRVDLEEYRAATGERIIAFTSSDFIDTSRLIVTYAKDDKNISLFREFLEKKVLPQV